MDRTELFLLTKRVRLAMPSNRDVQALCDEAERLALVGGDRDVVMVPEVAAAALEAQRRLEEIRETRRAKMERYRARKKGIRL